MINKQSNNVNIIIIICMYCENMPENLTLGVWCIRLNPGLIRWRHGYRYLTHPQIRDLNLDFSFTVFPSLSNSCQHQLASGTRSWPEPKVRSFFTLSSICEWSLSFNSQMESFDFWRLSSMLEKMFLHLLCGCSEYKWSTGFPSSGFLKLPLWP